MSGYGKPIIGRLELNIGVNLISKSSEEARPKKT